MKLGRFEICFCWSKGGHAKKWWELSIIFCYRAKKYRAWKKQLRAKYKGENIFIEDDPDLSDWVEEAAEIPPKEFDKLGK